MRTLHEGLARHPASVKASLHGTRAPCNLRQAPRSVLLGGGLGLTANPKHGSLGGTVQHELLVVRTSSAGPPKSRWPDIHTARSQQATIEHASKSPQDSRCLDVSAEPASKRSVGYASESNRVFPLWSKQGYILLFSPKKGMCCLYTSISDAPTASLHRGQPRRQRKLQRPRARWTETDVTMRTYSTSYLILKEQVQHSINFVVLVCHAVPSLKGYMKAVEHDSAPKLPTTDHFLKSLPHTDLRLIATRYKKTLGRFLFLSSFAYFESYCKSLIEEIIEFHGGVTRFEKAREPEPFLGANAEAKRRRLQEPRKAQKSAKYKKIGAELRSLGYVFPSEVFAAFGALQLAAEVKEVRASKIPDLMERALGLVWTDTQKGNFSRLREYRNKIAHGDSTFEVELSEAMNYNNMLRKLAITIDQAAVRRFMIVEER